MILYLGARCMFNVTPSPLRSHNDCQALLENEVLRCHYVYCVIYEWAPKVEPTIFLPLDGKVSYRTEACVGI
jgi:hypothetical protein